MPDEALHNTLKVQRALRNLTQADLATMAGVTRKSVNAIETGRMIPSVLLALKLADVLGVPVDTLFSRRPFALAPVPLAPVPLAPVPAGSAGGPASAR